jgi:peroxin-2
MQLVPARKLVKRNVSYEFMNRQMVWHAFTVSDPRHHVYDGLVYPVGGQEFTIFVLPLLNTRTLHRRFARLTAQVKPISLTSLLPFRNKFLPIPPNADDAPAPAETKGPYWSLSEDQCAICAENASYNLNFADSSNALTALSSVAPNLAPEHDRGSGEPPRFSITIPYITTCGHIYCYYCIADRILRVADEGDGEVPGWECLRCTQVVKGAERVEMEVEEGSVGELNSSEFDFSEISGSVTSYSESLTDEVEGS